ISCAVSSPHTASRMRSGGSNSSVYIVIQWHIVPVDACIRARSEPYHLLLRRYSRSASAYRSSRGRRDGALCNQPVHQGKAGKAFGGIETPARRLAHSRGELAPVRVRVLLEPN